MEIIYIPKESGELYFDPKSRFGCAIQFNEYGDKPFLVYIDKNYNYLNESNFKIFKIKENIFEELKNACCKRNKEIFDKLVKEYFN